MIHRSSYVYDNLLILFITLFYEDITSHPLSEIIEHAVNSDYSFFLDGLVITPESLRYLSYVLCAGESLGEVYFRFFLNCRNNLLNPCFLLPCYVILNTMYLT